VQVWIYVSLYFLLDLALMSAVMHLVSKATGAYRDWHRRIKIMSLMADRLAATQTGGPAALVLYYCCISSILFL
jgi:hypothetical protein